MSEEELRSEAGEDVKKGLFAVTLLVVLVFLVGCISTPAVQDPIKFVEFSLDR